MIRPQPRTTLFPCATRFRSHRPGPREVASDETLANHAPPAGDPEHVDGHRQRRSEEHTSELQSRPYLVCRILLEKKTHILTPRPPLSPVPRPSIPHMRSEIA